MDVLFCGSVSLKYHPSINLFVLMDCDAFLGWNGNNIRFLMKKYKACRLCLFNINDDDNIEFVVAINPGGMHGAYTIVPPQDNKFITRRFSFKHRNSLEISVFLAHLKKLTKEGKNYIIQLMKMKTKLYQSHAFLL